MKTFLSIGLILFTLSSAAQSEIRQVHYSDYTLWLDCDKKAAIQFQYIAREDHGNLARSKQFATDPNIASDCQQNAAGSYREKGHKTRFDRGHLVPANHLDHSPQAIQESNYMTNILPQMATMNRGAWYQTEEIIECYRDLEPLNVIGGAYWDNNIDPRFLSTHGLPDLPDAFWKIVIREDRVIAWWIPNSSSATRKQLDSYLVAPSYIEQMIGVELPITDQERQQIPATSWYIPRDCNRG